ncbi:sensor histidine kinase [Paenibacillus sp. MMS20-IR301]|uniref:sensor histidine kinase n=1 Tax=Paenibacillus sp. MMS20-IR301 TaxID=2895946 RepID=UPI0028EE39D9|nr:sensor histidine kinase [Paenibacillus sp. MMS20-IR301]WNS44152.1 sensor histidine kinase [Paenibacillus sp. MMS20-IR301]
MNLNLRYKITILIFLLITAVTFSIGGYSYSISKKQIINKVSNSNQSVLKQINSNLSRMQKTIADWVTVFSLASVVQETLRNNTADSVEIENQFYNGPTASMMNQMLVTGNFDYLSLYGSVPTPIFQVATDDSSGANSFDTIINNAIYKETVALNGASYWFPLTRENNVFIQSNRNEKLGMTRIIRDIVNGNRIGFVFVGINLETIRKTYLTNLYDQDHGILILNEHGEQLLAAGKETYSPKAVDFVLKQAAAGVLSGSTIVNIKGGDTLLNYNINEDGWITLYSVPLSSLTEELSSIKSAVLVMILASLVLSIPLLMFFSSFLTAPIKTLLLSMRRFQNGQFDEKVNIKYWDEIGQLSRGYNNMVANIKALVDDAYLLKLKEQEAELKALQSQINPHFLYNMLDTIFWEAESSGQDKISEMVINLSRLFRLSLNRGKSFTSVAKEKELIGLYLSLQKMRFKESLEFVIDIPAELEAFVILKLSLQPFIENALVHGIEQKRGGGRVSISGQLTGDKLVFVIEDNGGGMSSETLQNILKDREESDVYTAPDVGGYAVQNVYDRLKHFYKGDFTLNYSSVPGEGTRVEIVIPAIMDIEVEQ